MTLEADIERSFKQIFEEFDTIGKHWYAIITADTYNIFSISGIFYCNQLQPATGDCIHGLETRLGWTLYQGCLVRSQCD